jgi:hypothetical protein
MDGMDYALEEADMGDIMPWLIDELCGVDACRSPGGRMID